MLFVVYADIQFLALFSGVPTKQLITYSSHLSITAVQGAGRGYDATGSTVAACNDVNKLGGSNSSSDPHEMDENTLPHTRQSSISDV